MKKFDHAANLVKKTRINLVPLFAWLAFGHAVVFMAVLLLFGGTAFGGLCAMVGVVCGGIAATVAGPVSTVSYYKVR